MIKAVIFDFDLTLVNSLWQKLFMLWKFSRQNKASFIKILISLPKIFGMPARDLAKKYSSFPVKETMKRYNQQFIETEQHAKFKGKNILKELKKRKIKTGIISNELKDCILYSLKKHNAKVDIVLSTENTSKAKPHPYLLHKAMKKLKVKPSEVLYVGDHPKDIQMGKRAKVKTAGLINILHGKRALKKEKPDYLIRKLSEITSILDKINH